MPLNTGTLKEFLKVNFNSFKICLDSFYKTKDLADIWAISHCVVVFYQHRLWPKTKTASTFRSLFVGSPRTFNTRMEKCCFGPGPTGPGRGMTFIRNGRTGSGSVNPSVLKTLKRSAILARSDGLKPPVKQLVKSLQRIIHLDLKTIEMNLPNTSESGEIKWLAQWRVKEIKRKPQPKFIMNRLKKKKELQKAQDVKEVKQNIYPSHTKGSSWKTKWHRSYERMWTGKLFLTILLFNRFSERTGKSPWET